jgi:hypothetical protein
MYKIPVKIEAIEKRKKATDPLHLIGGFFLLGIAATLTSSTQNSLLYILPVYLIAIISIFYGVLRRKLDATGKYNHWIRVVQFLTFLMLAIYTVHLFSDLKVASLVIWGIVILFLMFTERKVFHDTDITIKNDGIYVPGYFTGHLIPWNNITDLVLRTDYITVSKSNNKFLQLEVVKLLAEEEIAQINEFSRQQVSNAIQNPLYT